jgi:hypothetical protein
MQSKLKPTAHQSVAWAQPAPESMAGSNTPKHGEKHDFVVRARLEGRGALIGLHAHAHDTTPLTSSATSAAAAKAKGAAQKTLRSGRPEDEAMQHGPWVESGLSKGLFEEEAEAAGGGRGSVGGVSGQGQTKDGQQGGGQQQEQDDQLGPEIFDAAIGAVWQQHWYVTGDASSLKHRPSLYRLCRIGISL